MIRKLKRKFVLINMSLVSLVLILVLGAILIFSYHQLKQDSFMAMEKAIDRPFGAAIPKVQFEGKRPDFREQFFPLVTILLDGNLEILATDVQSVEISDQTLDEITAKIISLKKSEGTLWDYQLRFMIKPTFEGIKIVLVDTSREVSKMISLVITLTLAGIGAIGAFTAISLYLAKWALRPVEKAWEQQRQFVADASHELKTPLTVILANTSILLKHPTETIGAQVKWIEYTQAEAERMKQLVDDLLFLAKYDQDHSPQMLAQVNLSDIAWSAILPYEPVAFENGVTIDTQIEDEAVLVGHEGQLKQLMMILLDNACKYAGQGGKVLVRIDKSQQEVLLSVNNTGAIIDKEHLPHIFDRFYRVDTSRAREGGGYGLGLAIASTIAQAHKGQIEVTSEAQLGTTFMVKLPTHN